MRPRAFALLLLSVVGFMPQTVQAQTGAIKGTVLDRSTGDPVAGARVSLVGTNRFVATNARGQYEFPNVTPGERQIRVATVGYSSQTVTLIAVADQAATVDFRLARAVITLDEVVVTALGEQSAREVSNALASVSAEQIQTAARQVSVTELLQGKVPGMTVLQSSGTVGTGHTIKIRGSSSLSLGDTPLIFVDGARIDNDNNEVSDIIWTGGQDASRLNDLNPEDIERIEIVKGPAASTLYGTEALGGVIQIFTKKGRRGAAPEWSFRAGTGANVRSPYEFPPNVWNPLSFGFSTDTLYSMNLLKEFDPFRTGILQTYAGSVRGGTDDVTYYVSGQYENEEGTLPNNQFSSYSARGNFTVSPSAVWDLQGSIGYTSNFLMLPDNDNNDFGYLGVAMVGFPWAHRISMADPSVGGEPMETCPLAFEIARDFGLPLAIASSSNCPQPNKGGFFANRSFDDLKRLQMSQDVERMTGSVTLRVRPVGFWSNRLTLGYDLVNERTGRLIPVDAAGAFDDRSTGRRTFATETNRNLSIDYSTSVSFDLGALRTLTSFGFQYYRQVSELSHCNAQNFTAGATTCSNAARSFGFEGYEEAKTLGLYFQEQFSFRERVFVTPAVRFDANSAFGRNFGLQAYPKLGVSVIAIDQSIGFLDQLKLRVAWGRSGKQPPTTAALQTFTPRGFNVANEDVLGVTPAQPGNPDLSPELGEEWELGFDVGLVGNRVGLQATYYAQETRNGLVRRPRAPSLGFPQPIWDNIGRIENRGFEIALEVAAIPDPDFRWDWTFNLAANRNKITELATLIPLSFSAAQRHQEGFPFGAYFTEIIVLDDNGNPMIEPHPDPDADLADGSVDHHQFNGQPLPKWEGSVTTSLTLFRYLTLYALLDFKGGHRLWNVTEAFRCGFIGGGENGGVCPEIFERDATGAPTDAARIKQFASSIESQHPYTYDADFAKLRTVSLKFQFPDAWARTLKLKRASVTLAGQNVKTWTGYPGADPEINGFGQHEAIRAEFLTLPPHRRFTTTVSLTF